MIGVRLVCFNGGTRRGEGGRDKGEGEGWGRWGWIWI